MRIHVAAIGRLKKSPEKALADDYFERTRKSGRSAGITGLEIREFAESQAASVNLRKHDEAGRLRAACPPHSHVIALDEGGKDMTSMQLAHYIGQLRDNRVSDLAFFIGGPDGHDNDLLKAADLKIAMGRMTWPHRLARIMLAEQIYRSITILLNHPYHRS